jgi:hypothetical protein
VGDAERHHGWMQVDADREASRLTLFLSMRHAAEQDHEVAATLDAIHMLVEAEL